MSFFADISNGPTQGLLSGLCLTKGVLAINAASAATVKTTNALTYSVAGQLYSKAALAAQSIAVTHDARGQASGAYVQPVSTTVFYTVALNAAGTVSVSQGDFAGRDLSQQASGAYVRGDGLVPDAPAGYTPIGVIKVTTNGSTTFTPGTTALDAAGVTVVYADVMSLPKTF